MGRRLVPPVLLGIFVLFWAYMAIDPRNRELWLIENLMLFATVPALVIAYRWFRFSDASYLLWFIFLSLHVVGSHWAYSYVPVPEWTGLQGDRNNFDRFVHAMYGVLLALPFAELCQRFFRATPAASLVLAVQAVVATSAVYEIIEWLAAVVLAPGHTELFLGQQGDHFDAVKDIALASAGAVVAVLVIRLVGMPTLRQPPGTRAADSGHPAD